MRYYRRNTTNLISVILSIFALFGLLVAAPGIYGSVLNNYCVVMAAFLLVMPLINALLQNMAVKQVYDPEKYFFTLNFNESVLYEALVCASAIVLLFFIPSTDLRVLGWPMTIIIVGIWSAVAAGTTWASYQFTKIMFMSDAILVKGFNFFKSAGLSQKTTTGLGVYTYDEFDSFMLHGDKMVMKLTEGRGQVSVKLPKNLAVQVTQFLVAKGIVRKES